MKRIVPILLAATLAACAARPPAPITRPVGPEPFGAVLLVPGCGGAGAHTERAARELVAAGFAVAQIDAGVCSADARAASPAIRREFARLAALPGVDRARLHLVGWSEGGAGVMAALAEIGARSAAAFYPACANVAAWRASAPFLMILAENDTVTPPAACLDLMERTPGAENVLAVRYGGVAHGFDNSGQSGAAAAPWTFWRLTPNGGYNPAVRDAALLDLRIFLDGSDQK
ncbi:MAG: dienelactone hydrolase family protein [Magnetospirillum sp.]|nr:dienelactone hydrolase family protein [Magnetospirillum sp.]